VVSTMMLPGALQAVTQVIQQQQGLGLWLGLALEQAGWRTSPYFVVTGQ